MSASNKNSVKRAYAAPKLVTYGDMAQLTKGGNGSVTEVTAGNNGIMFRS